MGRLDFPTFATLAVLAVCSCKNSAPAQSASATKDFSSPAADAYQPKNIGLSVTSCTQGACLNMPECQGGPNCVDVFDVAPNSIAGRAGVEPEDVIVGFQTPYQLQQAFSTGLPVDFEVVDYRTNSRLEVVIDPTGQTPSTATPINAGSGSTTASPIVCPQGQYEIFAGVCGNS